MFTTRVVDSQDDVGGSTHFRDVILCCDVILSSDATMAIIPTPKWSCYRQSSVIPSIMSPNHVVRLIYCLTLEWRYFLSHPGGNLLRFGGDPRNYIAWRNGLRVIIGPCTGSTSFAAKPL